MTVTDKRPRGRPRQPENVRRRASVTLRIRDQTRAALEKHAAANVRSLSEEAETRLDQSLNDDAIMKELRLIRKLLQSWMESDNG